MFNRRHPDGFNYCRTVVGVLPEQRGKAQFLADEARRTLRSDPRLERLFLYAAIIPAVEYTEPKTLSPADAKRSSATGFGSIVSRQIAVCLSIAFNNHHHRS